MTINHEWIGDLTCVRSFCVCTRRYWLESKNAYDFSNFFHFGDEFPVWIGFSDSTNTDTPSNRPHSQIGDAKRRVKIKIEQPILSRMEHECVTMEQWNWRNDWSTRVGEILEVNVSPTPTWIQWHFWLFTTIRRLAIFQIIREQIDIVANFCAVTWSRCGSSIIRLIPN